MLARSVTVALLGLILLVPAPAWGQDALSVEIRHRIELDGNGSLTADTSPDQASSFAWRRCPPDGSACTPVAGDPNDPAELHVGDAPAGTVFEVTATAGGQSASARSVPYRGRMQATAAPGLVGRLRVGALVRPTPAGWTGGWGLESSYLQTQACKTRTGRRCVVLADPGVLRMRGSGWAPCPGTGAVLEPRHAGWYVRVIDSRGVLQGPVGPIPLILITRPEGFRPMEPSPRRAAATFGPITTPAIEPPESTCGLVPRARLLRRARPTRTGALVGWVSCPRGCRVRLRVRRRGFRTVTSTRRVVAWPERPLVLPRRHSARLAGRRVHVLVTAKRHWLAEGIVRLPRHR